MHWLEFLKKHRTFIAGIILLATLMAFIESSMGRLLLGPDGRFGWWEANVWGPENSQRVADPYSFSHILHGIVFFALLWLVLRKLAVRWRFLIAVLMEVSWEILENSPIIINRYREATIAVGYVGDSILNSCSDLIMMSLGFWLAYRCRVRTSIVTVVLMEMLCLFWVRDNLTLNVVMLVYPIEAIKVWQSAGQPLP